MKNSPNNCTKFREISCQAKMLRQFSITPRQDCYFGSILYSENNSYFGHTSYFYNDRIPQIKPIYEVNQTWFVKMETEEACQDTAWWLRSQKFRGEPVKVAIYVYSNLK